MGPGRTEAHLGAVTGKEKLLCCIPIRCMDHFEHPRNVGEIANADGVGQVGNAKCGDIMKMYLKSTGT